MTTTKTLLTLGPLLLLACLRAEAQPGTLDATFGAAGITAVNIGESYDARPSVSPLPNGKTIVVSERRRDNDGSWSNLAVTRLLVGGVPDPAFGEEGTTIVPFGPNEFSTTAFGALHLVQADGKVVVGGQYHSGPDQTNYDIILARLDTAGALDPTFGKGGKLVLDVSEYDGVLALAQQPDGKLLIGGYTRNVATSYTAQFALLRCHPDGTLDSTFGTAGCVKTTMTESDILYSLSILADGRIVGVGSGIAGAVRHISLARYTSNGALDTTFANGGIAAIPINAAQRVDQIVLHANNSATALCDTSLAYTTGSPFLVHITPEGKLDTAYGIGGRVMVAPEQTNSSLAPIDNGGVVVAGVRSGDSALVVRRFTATGATDTTFAQNGTLVNDPGTPYDYGYGPGSTALAVRSAGEIIAAGLHVVSGAFTVSLLEMSGAGERNRAWGVEGRAEIQHTGGGNDYVLGTAVQPQGRILVGGYSTINRTYYHDAEFVVSGFTPNGTLDPSFGSGGTAVIRSSRGRLLSFSPLHLLSDGSILMGGSLRTLSNPSSDREEAALIRLTADGAPDASFGENGLVIYHDAASQYLAAFDVAQQDDGKILLVGYNDSKAILVRFRSNGVVDSTFGVAGKIEFGLPQSYGYRILVRPGGEIVVAEVANSRLTLRQFRSNGKLDSLFGVKGAATLLSMGYPNAAITSMALQSDGKLVLCGHRRTSQYDGYVARVAADGKMDGSFGSGGIAAIAVTPDQDEILSCVAVQADGNILVSGTSGHKPPYFQFENSQPLLLRLRSDGTPDSTFGTAGRATAPFAGGEYHDGGQIALLPNGKIVLGIEALRENNTDVAVMQIESGLILGVEQNAAATSTPHLFRSSTDGRWTLKYREMDAAMPSVNLVDMRGEVVQVIEPGRVSGGGWATTTFSTDRLPRGAYIVRIAGGSSQIDLKLMNY